VESWTVAGLSLAPFAGAWVASYFGEVRGVHDWLVPSGAVFRASQPHIVLTFDDGPDPAVTPRLLDVLAAAKARAVFFLVGENVERHPALVRRIADEGHVLGNHSCTHPWFIVSSRARIAAELDRCQKLIEDAAGQSAKLVRPPYGQRDWRFNQLARERGLTPVLWSKNLRDYWGSAPEVLVRRLGSARAGDIVLMHDGDPKAKHTVTAVETWLKTGPSVGLL
jgi:endo-1,4-beta-xylanase